MARKIFIIGLVSFTLFIFVFSTLILAQEKVESKETVTEPETVVEIPHKPRAFGGVGDVEYVDYKAKEPAIVIKDKAGKSTKVLLNDLKPGSTLLVTYRKEEDKNILISLSVIKTAEAPKTAGGKKK